MLKRDEIAGKTIYIAGPMRGYAYFNFEAFDYWRDVINAAGATAISPADLDRHATGFDPIGKPHAELELHSASFDLKACIARDTAAIQSCDAVFMLEGWEKSTGASAEHTLARWLGLPIYYQIDPLPSPIEEALEITRGDRNASYGDPQDDFARTAAMWSAYLQTDIEAHDVGWCMVLLKASRNVHKSKRDNYVDAAGYLDCAAKCEGHSRW